MKETKTRDLKKIIGMSYVDEVASEDFSEETAATYSLFYADSLLFLHLPLKGNHCIVFPMYVFVCVCSCKMCRYLHLDCVLDLIQL